MAPFNIERYLQEKKQQVDCCLDAILPPEDSFPAKIHKAMRYCLFAGGKRLRPILALAAAEAVGADPAMLIREASAIELIHTYTLIHDDLPAMDDDDYRRGLPSTHKVFGEAVAILAGDALLTYAFKILADGRHAPEKMVGIIREVAQACGSGGVIGGQMVDLESEGKKIDADLLEYMHTHKTGQLISVSVFLGATLGGGSKRAVAELADYSRFIGLVFQITDDMLDIVGSTESLGKKVGSDSRRGKATYPGILGMEATRQKQQQLYRNAVAALRHFDEKAEPLRCIARLIVERQT